MSTTANLRMLQLLESDQPVKIVCFGDSITGIYYHTGGRQAWSHALGDALKIIYPRAQLVMINAGISGNTTAHALNRMQADVLEHRPNLIVVMFGMNDAVHLSPEIFHSNLQQIVQQSHANEAEVVLMTPNTISPEDPARVPTRLAAFAQIVRDVARESSVALAETYRVFEDIRLADPHEWMRIMSDPVHPNMRGHQLFATIVAETISGRKIARTELPALPPSLPHLQALLESRGLIRITAMKPVDALIESAIRALYPDAQLEINAWDPTGKPIREIEELAKQNGWFHYNKNPFLPKPDLSVVAVPSSALVTLDRNNYLSYGWVINWSQSYGNDPRADCLPILPSVWEAALTESDLNAEQFALEGILDKNLPYIQRNPGDHTPTTALITHALTQMLKAGFPANPFPAHCVPASWQ